VPTPFIHLHAHSHYSFLRGLASPQALAQAAAEAGMSALALANYARAGVPDRARTVVEKHSARTRARRG